WRFIKWFTSAETQSSYCRRMESVIGTGAKQPTANTEALSLLSWTSEEYRNLSSQMNNAVSLPNPPGSYYMARTFSFAFNRVYSSSGEQSMAENPNDVLVEYVKELNDELKRKQKEFDE
ncbi:MAG: ABC transporter substrate-binding protein, partial [Clostridia bacterium]|nr:ABC transporter substrate-binding protein [Clostridia bacterium]